MCTGGIIGISRISIKGITADRIYIRCNRISNHLNPTLLNSCKRPPSIFWTALNIRALFVVKIGALPSNQSGRR